MKVVSLAMVILFAISLTMASACGGGNDGELEQALQSVQENDLAIMVLPQEDIGEEFADMEIDDDSGFVDSEEAADDTIDPEDTADDLEQAGRVNGYSLGYETPDWFSALLAGAGLLAVGTDLDLFEDAEAASDFVLKQINDYLSLEGEEVEVGVTLEKVDVFEVEGLADEAMGVKARISFGDLEMYVTFVGFRIDRLLGSASIGRADDADVLSQVEDIVRALEERIEGVLLGDISGTPVPVPQAEEEAAAAPPSEGGPDLAARMPEQSDGMNGTTVALDPTFTTSWLGLIPGSEEFGAASESSCQFPEDITSYRYVMEMNMEFPELIEEFERTTEEDGLEDELEGLFDESLLAFLEDMKMEGAYVAPDRSWDRAMLGGELFAESIRIGERTWTRLGGTDWTAGESGPGWSVTVSPSFSESLCDIGTIDALFAALGVEPQKETINGIKAIHYHMDETDMLRLAALFGEVESAEEMPESATVAMDIWLAEDGDWPVRMEAEIGYTDEEGQSFSFDLFMEVKDINDPGIEIEPPM